MKIDSETKQENDSVYENKVGNDCNGTQHEFLEGV
jgi:hypothetical protein